MHACGVCCVVFVCVHGLHFAAIHIFFIFILTSQCCFFVVFRVEFGFISKMLRRPATPRQQWLSSGDSTHAHTPSHIQTCIYTYIDFVMFSDSHSARHRNYYGVELVNAVVVVVGAAHVLVLSFFLVIRSMTFVIQVFILLYIFLLLFFCSKFSSTARAPTSCRRSARCSWKICFPLILFQLVFARRSFVRCFVIYLILFLCAALNILNQNSSPILRLYVYACVIQLSFVFCCCALKFKFCPLSPPIIFLFLVFVSFTQFFRIH